MFVLFRIQEGASFHACVVQNTGGCFLSCLCCSEYRRVLPFMLVLFRIQEGASFHVCVDLICNDLQSQIPFFLFRLFI